MALVTISVSRTAGAGRTTVEVGLCSDADLTPHEHESLHRRLVTELLPEVEFERIRPAQEPVVG